MPLLLLQRQYSLAQMLLSPYLLSRNLQQQIESVRIRRGQVRGDGTTEVGVATSWEKGGEEVVVTVVEVEGVGGEGEEAEGEGEVGMEEADTDKAIPDLSK